MKIQVLGAAAGGGFPQWNCNHPNSRRARLGDPMARPRTQSSIAVSADGERWVLFNASPDLRQQINANPVLHPRRGLRDSPLKAVLLTNADVDHVTGLLTLRESQPFVVHATPRVLDVLAGNSIFNVLNPAFVTRRPIALDALTELVAPDGAGLGVVVRPFAVPGKVALWLEDLNKGVKTGAVTEDTIGIEVLDTAGTTRFFYVPGCESMPVDLAARLQGAPLVFFDGTLYTDDEMIRAGVGVKTGKRMGHMSVSGPDGTIAAFRDLNVGRRIFIHINTTNPILVDDSPERATVGAAGWDVAYDGMSLEA